MMSIVLFKCEDKFKEELKIGVFKILHKHYLNTVSPNTHVKYKDEGEGVYSHRLNELMKTNLCNIEDTDNGISLEFDSTEEAGFLIADSVYETSMGYSDDGLTYLKPLFDNFIKEFPEICFEAECQCYDKWISEEYNCSYDGKTFECDAEWMDFEE